MRIFAIKNDDRSLKTTSYLIYYETADKYIVEITSYADEWSVPMYFAPYVRKNIRTVTGNSVITWVGQRIVPADRQNISQILVDNNIKSYNEFDLLMLCSGRCAQDDYYLKEISFDKLPDEIKKRNENRIDDIIPLDDFKFLVFLKNGSARIGELKKIIEGQRALNNYLNQYPEKFFDMKIQIGGTGIYWNDNMTVSDVELYRNSKKFPLTKNNFSFFIKNKIVNSSEAAEILNCSRQYVDSLVKKGKLTPVKTTQNNRMFYESDIIKLTWK